MVSSLPSTSETSSFTKKSLGIILISRDLSKVILIKKRYTYEFDDFLHGKYDPLRMDQMRNLFSNMTLEEKLIIKSRNYEHMWFHKHLGQGNPLLHQKGSRRFFEAFGNGRDQEWADLLRIINGTTYKTSTMYEFPKGRKNDKNEPNIITAMREVEEETHIKTGDYRLVPHIKKTTSKVEGGVRYLCIYYVAVVTKPVNPCIRITSAEQCFEVSEVGWYSLSEIQKINTSNHLPDICKAVIQQLRQEKKSSKKRTTASAAAAVVRPLRLPSPCLVLGLPS